MKYVRLGTTGLRVSRLCLGCMSYGTPEWRPWVREEANAKPFFRRAVEAGVNFFDTADGYSLGASEEVTGRALREYANLDECVLCDLCVTCSLSNLGRRQTSGPGRIIGSKP